MDSELLKHLPASLQIWQKIESEAERRAQARFQEILKKNGKATDGSGPQHSSQNSAEAVNNGLSYKQK